MHLSPIAGGGLTLSATAVGERDPAASRHRPQPRRRSRSRCPTGRQAQLPGVLWPNPSVWTLNDRTAAHCARPPIEIRQLTRKQANVLTGAWHDLGEETRPFAYTAFGLYVSGEPVAVATAGTTVSASVEASPPASID